MSEHKNCGCTHNHAAESKNCAAVGKESGVTLDVKTQSADNVKTVTYSVEGLDCANCGAKIEKSILGLAGVRSASLTFATKQLRVTAVNPDALLPDIQKEADRIENGVSIKPLTKTKPALAEENKKSALMSIILGAVLFIGGELFEKAALSQAALITYIAAYFILGWPVLTAAFKNMMHGQLFDENFLMSLATIAAFVIAYYPEAVAVMLFFRIGEYFEDVAVARSRSQIMDAVDMRPETVALLEGDEVKDVPAEDAKVGDLLLIRPGDRIPLDGVIIEGESRIDTSPVTGESVPVKAKTGDKIISGTVNTSGLLKIRVEKPLSESMVTKILDSVENAAANKPQIDKFITRFARIYTPIVVIAAIATAIIPSLITGNWNHWVYTAVTFLVISCPCALVLSVPLAFFSGIGAASKIGILFKGGIAMEAVKTVKTVVMDKTGTITKGNFVVQALNPIDRNGGSELLALAAACELSSTHPIGASILADAKAQKLTIPKPEQVTETAGGGIQAMIDGNTVLCGNQGFLNKEHVNTAAFSPSEYGTEVLVAENGKYLGSILISDTLKPEAKQAVSRLKKLGLKTVMLTGDAEQSAHAVANEAGIDEVHARLLPQDKLSELESIRARDGAVMFVGDGINDAPVLAGADVGAAMGSGSDAAIEAADVVFMTNNVQAVADAVQIGADTSRIAWQNVIFAIAMKVIVMVLGLLGLANMWLAIFADTGVAIICILNSIRLLYKKNYRTVKQPESTAEVQKVLS